MCATMTLRFLLLGLFVLMLQHAVGSTVPSCTAPTLENGYFYPNQSLYSNNQVLTYACDIGHKPVVEGWWATITCQSDGWSDVARCIDEKACVKPSIPNSENIDMEGNTLEFTCKTGYEPQSYNCVDGSWSSMPVCASNVRACGEPPQVPHAVVIYQHYREEFADGTMLLYECEEGYTTEKYGTKASVTCQKGTWTAGPTCRRTVTENDGSTTGTGESVTPSSGVGLNRCGEKPFITNAEIVQTGSDYLKYACPLYYKLEGPDTVRCLNNGLWTPLPFCREAFCHVNTEDYPFLINIQAEFLLEGEKKRFKCVEKWGWFSTYSEFECMDGIVKHTDCCTKATFLINKCEESTI
ncbi:complement factor H-like [Gouania willdenowi]|uniref:complement factor H-like n=1 Tax=Gouania willdenowi TaxID=441366 RepID=UPI00105482CB|nr:complement factor H-like [Gouania willdenowi]XP_028329269.1 complement factor H-like [Gouania willdenowi]XP_028329270.1 complement factor H-like [Gouania willdenowi]XP_028329272.1 complement factor H-like [Gouania willdenowi]